MKRYGYLIEQVIEESNLMDAFDTVMRGKKRTRIVRYLKKTKDSLLAKLAEEIKAGTYKPAGYREFEVLEHGKMREIQSLPFRDRIALHAIMNILGGIFSGMLIRNTFASLPGRGIHDGLRRVRKALKDIEATKYCLKIDIKKFYHSIDQDVLIDLLGRKIKDARFMAILVGIIRSYDTGLPIGYHSSQLLGNFYLFALDYYVKETLGVKYYFRYCDDIVILCSNKQDLHAMLEKMRTVIEGQLHLTVKSNYQVFPVEARGIDFLGYVIRHDYVLVRKHIKARVARKLHLLKSRERRHKVLASFWGWAKHCNSKHLFYKLTGMKSFKDLGIQYKPSDGKKRFVGSLTPLSDLQNCTITILDFETDVATKQGENRYVVQYEMDGQKGKFITASDEMKNILDQVKAQEALPFQTTIRREIFGTNKTKYNFT